MGRSSHPVRFANVTCIWKPELHGTIPWRPVVWEKDGGWLWAVSRHGYGRTFNYAQSSEAFLYGGMSRLQAAVEKTRYKTTKFHPTKMPVVTRMSALQGFLGFEWPAWAGYYPNKMVVVSKYPSGWKWAESKRPETFGIPAAAYGERDGGE